MPRQPIVINQVMNHTQTGDVLPEVGGRFVPLLAIGMQGRYQVGWRIIIDKCPYTGELTGVDYIGYKQPSIGKYFGTLELPDIGLHARVYCKELQPNNEAERMKFLSRIGEI